MRHFAIDADKINFDPVTSAGLAQLVVCRAHTTHRIQSVVAMPRSLLEATDRKVSFLNGYPAGWSCLLFKTSGVRGWRDREASHTSH